MLIYKSKYLDIWRRKYSDWGVWLVPREFVVIKVGTYRIGVCWRSLVRRLGYNG